jgi:integrase
MGISYKVRFWKTEIYKGKRATTYYVRWTVDGKPWREPFTKSALAESFRSQLVSAASKGEAFDVDTGRPVSMLRTTLDMSWYAFACKYADLKWPTAAATTRRTNAEALAKVTIAMISGTKGKPDDKVLRHALNRWAFNTKRRNASECPAEIRRALQWAEKNTHNVSKLADPEILRPVLRAIGLKLDGKPGAPSVVNRQRKVFSASLWYAVELKLLSTNPIPALKRTPVRVSQAIDKRSVANPVQVRTLLDAVRGGPSGERLVAFFGCLYFAALRPEEAVGLGKHNLALPKVGWGELLLDGAEPYAGSDWTDDGSNRDRRRQLKQREIGEGRTVPCPPELTALLNEHIERFGFGPDGRLFVGERNKTELPKGTINRAWRAARRAVFTPEVYASPLAATPYDLRHACISLWIVAGVDPATAAKWAGQSIEILFRIYAAWLSGQEKALRRNIEDAYGGGSDA